MAQNVKKMASTTAKPKIARQASSGRFITSKNPSKKNERSISEGPQSTSIRDAAEAAEKRFKGSMKLLA